MSDTSEQRLWLDDLERLAVDFCESVVLIDAPPEVRPWNADQLLWAGKNGPSPSDEVLAYRRLGEGNVTTVAVLGDTSRVCLSRFVERFFSQPGYRSCYGVAFLRDMLVGLLQLSLPGATIQQLASPYWKRYVASAVSDLQSGSAQRYGEATVAAVRALPCPHRSTVVVLPLAGVTTLAAKTIGGVTLLPAASCTADGELGGCAMFLRRLKELQQRREEASLVFAKVSVAAEPGRAVQRAVHRAEQVCRLLRLLPNPGLADAPLADPPRIDLDAEDSAAFYIAATSVGTHPIPVRRTTTEPQGKLNNWRVEPKLGEDCWQRLASLIERGARSDIEARMLAGLRHLGDAVADPQAGPAAFGAASAVVTMLGTPEGFTAAEPGGGEAPTTAEPKLEGLARRAAVLLGKDTDQRESWLVRARRVCALRRQLLFDLDRPVLPQERSEATWLAFSVLRELLGYAELKGYADLVQLSQPSRA